MSAWSFDDAPEASPTPSPLEVELAAAEDAVHVARARLVVVMSQAEQALERLRNVRAAVAELAAADDVLDGEGP